MGIFRQFPYSNFHELNLDEIIKIMRQMQDEWAATKTEWASYKDFIDNYFNTLDVSEEVLEALRIMAASGELNTIIDPTIAAETAAWLADHISQPTTPAIDTSLSIAGAAADAKAAGDFLRELLDSMVNFSNFNLLYGISRTNNTINGVTYTWSGDTVTLTGTASPASFNNIYANTSQLPSNFKAGENIDVIYQSSTSFLNLLWYASGSLIRNDYVNNIQTVNIPDNADGCIIRIYVVSGVSVNETLTPYIMTKGLNQNLKYYGVLSATPYTLETMPEQSIVLDTNTGADSPIQGISAWIITLGGNFKGQFWIAAGNARIYYRYKALGNTYGAWLDALNEWTILTHTVKFTGALSSGFDLNDCEVQTISIDTGNCLNSPHSGYAGYVTTLGDISSSHTQLWIEYGNGSTYYRRGLAGTWYSWVAMNGSGAGGNGYAKMFSLCNSILSGAVYINGVLDHLCLYGNAPYSCVADAIGVNQDNVTHILHSSTGILYDAGNGSFTDTITSTDLSNYDCVLTHFWLADMENYNIGSLSSTAGDGTLAGAILEILAYMKTNNGKARLLLASVPPSSYAISGNNVFTGVYANGSSIADLDTLMHQLAAREHFIYVDFQNWNLSYYYQNYTDGSNVHLNSDAAYRALGGYIGGKFSSEIKF